MTWIQLSSKGTDINKKYNVSGIPNVVLIDKKGEIYGNKLRGDAIRQHVIFLIEKDK